MAGPGAGLQQEVDLQITPCPADYLRFCLLSGQRCASAP